MTWGNICLIPVNPSTLNLETPSLVSDLWYTKFILAYTSTNTRFCVCHIQGKHQLRTYLLPVTDWYDSFEKYPIPVPVRYERRNKENSPYHDQSGMFKSTYHFNTGPDFRLKDKELSIHVEHALRRGCSSHPCCQGETIVSYSCSELQSSEFRLAVVYIFTKNTVNSN
jgi:hypothetical protein